MNIMNRKLITQIKNECRDNIWMIVELTVVAVAIWLLTIFLFMAVYPKFDETGTDINDVYKIKIKTIDSQSPEYQDFGDSQKETEFADMRMLMRRIRKSPYVEAAAFSCNAMPYQYNYQGNGLNPIGSTDSILYNGNVRMGSPEIVRVLRPVSHDNLSYSEMEDMLRKGGILISHSPLYDRQRDTRKLIGQKVMLFDTVYPKLISGIISDMKRSEYEHQIGTILAPIDESQDNMLSFSSEIAVRVKSGMGKKFEEEFLTDRNMRKLRNVYLTELTDMADARRDTQYSQDTQVRLIVAGIMFLLIIIFLGLLGTFWFRIRQRSAEIALRMTCGATSGDIFRRTIGEGILLLLITMIPTLIIEVILHFKFVVDESFPFWLPEWLPSAAAFAFTLIIMAAMIVAGVVFPARKAMKIEPAIALKEE